MEYEQGDIVLCTVEKIIGTTVFVKLENGKEGTITLSEIAPGRIRNLRDYVVPKKKIVCKILKIFGENIHLSLRRVNQKEQKGVMQKYKLEKSYESILKSILGESAKEIISKIKKQENLYEFLEKAKENPKELEKIIPKEKAKSVLEILKEQKQKKAIINKKFILKSNSGEGLSLIKEVLTKVNDAKISYISAGLYSIKKESTDIKKADNEVKEILNNIESFAKKNHMDFEIKEKEKK